MSIAEFIQERLGANAQGWQSKQTQIESVRQEVERLQTQVQELQTAKEQTPLQKVWRH
jgi:prefoldin subunit 5